MRADFEIWKPIKGYEGLYEVNNWGDVRSLDRVTKANRNSTMVKRGKLLKQPIANNYKYVTLYKNGVGRKYKVHRLVAEAFVPNPDNQPLINHRNEIKTDNFWKNLEFCTLEYNVNYGSASERRLQTYESNLQKHKNTKQVLKYSLDGKLLGTYNSLRSAAKDNNLYHTQIANVAEGKPHCLTAGGYIWKYA